MSWRNSFIVSDVLDMPWRVPDEVFQCMVTSPPYWGLRTYGTERWEGGDPKCQHTVIRRSGDQDKSATCRLCGAKRIDQQIGLEKTPEEYIAKTVKVFREIWRVLRKDGTVFLNMGDSYAGGGRAGKEGIQKWGGIESQNQDRQYGPPVGNIPGLKPKDLCGIP